MEDENTQQSVPVIEEELVTGTRPVKTGSVRVRKEVERIRKTVDMPAIRDVVDVSRVPVNRIITSVPDMREEGEILIIPVVEEEIVIQKRLVLKEEIHIRRRRVKSHVTKSATVGREHAVIERLDGEGRVIASSKPSRPEPAGLRKYKSLLE
jgi:uncharacterized protein (TIGR02271 family)